MNPALKQIATAIALAATVTGAAAQVIRGEASFIDTATGLEWLFSSAPSRLGARPATLDESRLFMTDFGIDLSRSATTVEGMAPYVGLMGTIGCCDLFFASVRQSFFSVVSGEERWGVRIEAGFVGGRDPFASVSFAQDMMLPGDRTAPFARVVDLGVTPPVPEPATDAAMLAGLAAVLGFLMLSKRTS